MQPVSVVAKISIERTFATPSLDHAVGAREPLLGVLTDTQEDRLITEQGQRWNVSPNLLRKVKDVESSGALSPLLIVDDGGTMTVGVGSDWFGVSPVSVTSTSACLGFNGRIRRRPISGLGEKQ